MTQPSSDLDVLSSILSLSLSLSLSARCDVLRGAVLNHSSNLCAVQEYAVASRIRCPRLERLRWRVDVVISSGSLSRVMRPTILMQVRRLMCSCACACAHQEIAGCLCCWVDVLVTVLVLLADGLVARLRGC